MNKRKIAILIAALTMVTGCSADPTEGQDAGGGAGDEEEYLVGHLAPFSGALAALGQRASQSIGLWEEEVNSEGGIDGRQVTVRRCDDEGSPEKAVTCVREFLDAGVSAIAATSVTGPTQAVLPLVREGGPILVQWSPNIIPDPSEDPYVFSASPTAEDLTQGLADYLAANGISRVGMIAATDASGESAVAAAEEVFDAEGMTLVVRRIDLEENDAGPQLSALVGEDVEVIYSAYSGGGATTVVRSYANLGLDIPLIVNYANLSETFANSIEDSMPDRLLGTGLRALSPEEIEQEEFRTRAEQFIELYQEAYAERPDMLNVTSWYISKTIEEVLRAADGQVDPDEAREYLESNVIETSLPLSFRDDRAGLDVSAVTVLELIDGVWTTSQPIR